MVPWPLVSEVSPERQDNIIVKSTEMWEKGQVEVCLRIFTINIGFTRPNLKGKYFNFYVLLSFVHIYHDFIKLFFSCLPYILLCHIHFLREDDEARVKCIKKKKLGTLSFLPRKEAFQCQHFYFELFINHCIFAL